MANTALAWVLALTVALVATPATGSLIGGGPDGTSPPGVTDGELASASSLLDAHTSLLVAEGFAANGSGDGTVVRRGVLVDVERTANRTVAADATAYRQSWTTEASAAVGSVTRQSEFWGNETVETRRTVENGRTSYRTGDAKSDASLSGARIIRPYLRAGNFTVTSIGAETVENSFAVTPTETPVGGTHYALAATSLANETRLLRTLPDEASDPRNFSADAEVDEEGRIHAFEASVEYTIRGQDRTHTFTYTLRALGDITVSRPPWVAEALTGTATAVGS